MVLNFDLMGLYIAIAVFSLIIISFVVLQMLEGRLGQSEASETDTQPIQDFGRVIWQRLSCLSADQFQPFS